MKFVINSLLIAFVFSPLTAKANDPCSFLSTVQSELKTKEGILATIGSIYEKVHGLIETNYFSELNTEEMGIYFTRQPGFYFTLDCSVEDSNRRLEKIGMFGVGDTFKPQKKRYFSGEIYYYGLRRSGLMSFVRKDDLRKMENDKTYFFNRTEQKIQFCTNFINCDGAGKEFSARHNYAQMPTSEFKNIASKDSDCSIFNVSIFNGRNPLKAGPEYRKAQLEYCYHTKKNGVFHNTAERANTKIHNLTITGQYLLLSSQSLRDKIPFLFTKKMCLSKKTIKKNSVISLGGSIGAGLDFEIVELGAEIGIKKTGSISDEEIFEKDKQYLYQNYSATIYEKNRRPVKVLNDIIVTQTCEESTIPTKLNEIRIDVAPEKDQVIALNIKELDSIARKRFPGVWITASSTSRLKGRTWLIASVKQNMMWQEFVFDRVHRDLVNIVPDNIDQETLINYVDYFSSIFMATAFEFVPKRKVENIKIHDRF